MGFKIAVLDGSLSGSGGNTGALVAHFLAALPGDVTVDHVVLAEVEDVPALRDRLRAADGFVVASGTYWQSWGSPLQRFFEQATPWELTDVWVGKPVTVLVTMHSVGGAEVMARIMAVVNMLGAFVPPLCAMAYSRVGHLLREVAEEEDTWDVEDVAVMAANFCAAMRGEKATAVWKIAPDADVVRRWLK